MTASHPEDWIEIRPAGVYVRPAEAYVDPTRPVDRALVTHGHGDHARPGNRSVLATAETIAIMRARYGDQAGGALNQVAYCEPVTVGEVTVSFHPAGHVLGSAQIALEHQGRRIVFSGDYKRTADPTCLPFEPVACDVFVTEATFGLPVFRHPNPMAEIGKLLKSRALFPERAHVIGAYGLGKCQRLIALLRQAGYDRLVYLHGALMGLTELYGQLGVDLGLVAPATGAAKKEMAGEIVLAPPSAIADRWSRRLPDPVVAMASGWMRVRQRARQRGVELPLVISDHADWDELNRTIAEVDAPEVWVTHGREEALIHAIEATGRRGRALSLVGFEEDAVE